MENDKIKTMEDIPLSSDGKFWKIKEVKEDPIVELERKEFEKRCIRDARKKRF